MEDRSDFYVSESVPDNISPVGKRTVLEKRNALHRKYEQAVILYANTDMPLCEIAGKYGVSTGALGNYLRRYWRELVLRRHHVPMEGNDLQSIKVFPVGKQSPVAHVKYKDAVEACDTLKYIDLNISQVARKFNLDGTALANFMRVHYEDIAFRREKIRKRLGIADNIRRGARPECMAQYAGAVELYRTTDLSLPEVAEACHVSESGLLQHLRFYHKKVLQLKRRARKQARDTGIKVRGRLLGNGRKYEPSFETKQKYAEAVALYKNMDLSVKDIVRQTGVTKEGFRAYLHKWHKDLVLERLGITAGINDDVDLRKIKCRMKTTAAKYAGAIESLKLNPRPFAGVAAEFGFNPETFRQYIHKYEPELAKQLGMTRTVDGKIVLRRSEEKYREAVYLYETTTESLRSIAARLGLTYNSVGGYIRKNYPDVIQRHLNLIRK